MGYPLQSSSAPNIILHIFDRRDPALPALGTIWGLFYKLGHWSFKCKGFLCRRDGALLLWGQCKERGQAFCSSPWGSGMIFLSMVWRKPKGQFRVGRDSLMWWATGLVNNEPYFGWNSFSSSSRNMLAPGDSPSYNWISLCYCSFGLPKLRQATFDFFGII